MSATFNNMSFIALGLVIAVVLIVGIVIVMARSKSGGDTPKPPAPNPREGLSNFRRQAEEDDAGKKG